MTTEENAQHVPSPETQDAQKQGGEPESHAAPETAESQDPDSLKKRIAGLEDELAEAKDKALRYLADAEGARRRAQRDREDASKYAVGKFAKELLAVSDNLGRALAAIPPEAREQKGLLTTIAEGVEATERQLVSVLANFGVTRFDPLDQPFDAQFHRAMAEVPGTGKPAGTVVAVMQCGFMIHDRLLREALVCVAQGGATASAPPSAEEQAAQQSAALASEASDDAPSTRHAGGNPYGHGPTPDAEDHDSSAQGGQRKVNIQT